MNYFNIFDAMLYIAGAGRTQTFRSEPSNFKKADPMPKFTLMVKN